MKTIKYTKPFFGHVINEVACLTDLLADTLINDGYAVITWPKADKSQRKALLIKLEETRNEITELELMRSEIKRQKVEAWINCVSDIDLELKYRNKAFIIDCLEKNIYPI